MEEPAATVRQLSQAVRQFAQRLLTIGENRLELLTVEVQEERVRLLHTFLLALGVVAFGLLAGMAFTGLIVFLFWPYSPVGVLLALIAVYGSATIYLYRRLTRRLHDWQTLTATLDQLRKDRACLEKHLT